MESLLLAIWLSARALWWGMGLALLVTPPGLRKHAWLLMPGLGLALQMAVVWYGVWLNLPGTDSYHIWAEAIPLGLLIGALATRRRRRAAKTFLVGRQTWIVGAITVTSMLLLASPLITGGNGANTISLGNCDAPDYAAGARAMQQFRFDSQEGFLGQPDVHGLPAVGGFFGYWVRLNHFGPAAMIALNSSALGVPVYKIISLLGMLFFAALVPLTYVVARVVFGHPAWIGFLASGVIGLNPFWYYATYHGSLGQLLGGLGCTAVILTGGWMLRGPPTARRLARGLPLAVLAHWIVIGSYPFMVAFAYGLLGAWCLARAIQDRSIRRLVACVASSLAVLGLCFALFPSRLIGVYTSIRFFGNAQLGWPIPRADVAGFWGMVADSSLSPLSSAWGVALNVFLLLIIFGGLVLGWRNKDREWLTVVAFAGSIVIGYAWLHYQAILRQDLSSYKAYKLLAVFYAPLLCGLLYPLKFLPRRRPIGLGLGALACVVLIVANGYTSQRFRRNFGKFYFWVPPELAQIQTLESHPEIESINLVGEHFWNRIWSSALLMHKRQYFASETYVGRYSTELRGMWDLHDAKPEVIPVGALVLNSEFYLTRRTNEGVVPSVELMSGWWQTEPAHRWAGATGSEFALLLKGKQAGTFSLTLKGNPTSATQRFTARLDGKDVPVVLDKNGEIRLPSLNLTTGAHQLVIVSSEPPKSLNPEDPRQFLYKLFGIELNPQA